MVECPREQPRRLVNRGVLGAAIVRKAYRRLAQTIAVPRELPEGDSSSNTETVIPRVGCLVAQPGGYRVLVPSPLPPEPSLRPTRALDQMFDEAVRATTEFAADISLRARIVADETDEDANVRQAAELLVQGVAENGWSIALMCAAQASAVRGARGADRFPGRIRKAQNWIGSSLESASFVPPPGELLREELGELVTFLNHPDGFAPLVTAPLAFAQVVLIHAFNDGNGRLGRAVALAVLGRDGLPPELPLNRHLRMHRAAHLRAIEGVQRRGEWEAWITFFLRAVMGSARIADVSQVGGAGSMAPGEDERRKGVEIMDEIDTARTWRYGLGVEPAGDGATRSTALQGGATQDE